jgi:hypothetical protein
MVVSEVNASGSLPSSLWSVIRLVVIKEHSRHEVIEKSVTLARFIS